MLLQCLLRGDEEIPLERDGGSEMGLGRRNGKNRFRRCPDGSVVQQDVKTL